ncbi:hypothetical protein K402DRAFT_381787 [Aulographum hederae CBS 113979]|uniref:Zn(2)-C6 fungal-type domain-containing protein n=1 Tax=Aulographum hederae CBS 113979 TaxID=1176131 RepID=A0A6G1GTA7_9PEZI|nr:hypothetical protein K402DRAFT_381787 [Aulographum hederae CBS 113979]
MSSASPPSASGAAGEAASSSQAPADSSRKPQRGNNDNNGGSSSTAAATTAQQRIRRRNRLITSCLECRRRKLKCDKAHPCTNCIKFARDCVFLAPALDPAAQMRIQEIKEKMGSLERTLEEDIARRSKARAAEEGSGGGGEGAGSPFGPGPGELLPGLEGGSGAEEEDEGDEDEHLEPTRLAVEDAAYYDDGDDELMDLGISFGKMRITERLGGLVRPKMAEELKFAMDEVPEVPNPDGSKKQEQNPLRHPGTDFLGPGKDYVAPASTIFFSPDPRRSNILHFLPSRATADKLIQQYFEAVHYIARVVHRPSFERQYLVFWRQISSGNEPPTSFQAIVMAALLSAVISMDEDAVMTEFGVAKNELVDNFRQGTETALSKANFLRTTKLETLQAFVMYLIPLCRSSISRAHSALTGTALRLAQCMSLHRDGSLYNLSPVEIHVRRLIWYQLLFLDIRTCEATGPRPQIRPDDFDTKFPLNVDDEDLESTTPPTTDSNQWTDMTVTRMRFECNELHRLIWNERPRIERKKTTITSLLSKIQKFHIAMEKKYVPMLDESKPLHLFGMYIYKVLALRMHIMVLHRYASNAKRLMPTKFRNLMLSSGTVQVEYAIAMDTNPAVKQYAWYAGTSHQYHTAILLLSELYATRDRPYETRIWRCLDFVFELPSEFPTYEKSRMVLSELGRRVGVYQGLRRIRAPKSMEGVVGRRPVDAEERPPRRPIEERMNNVYGGVGAVVVDEDVGMSPDQPPEIGENALLGGFNLATPEPPRLERNESIGDMLHPRSASNSGLSSSASASPHPARAGDIDFGSYNTTALGAGQAPEFRMNDQGNSFAGRVGGSAFDFGAADCFSGVVDGEAMFAPPLDMETSGRDGRSPSEGASGVGGGMFVGSASESSGPTGGMRSGSVSGTGSGGMGMGTGAGTGAGSTAFGVLGNSPVLSSPGQNQEMLDIDWNEWDRLFPPNVPMEDSHIPDFSMPDFGFGGQQTLLPSPVGWKKTPQQ